VVGDPVGEAEQAALGQHPQRDGGHDLGVGIEQPERIVGRRAGGRFGDGVAEALEQRQLAVTGERDLAAGVAARRDMALDQVDQAVDLAPAEAERVEIGRRQGKARFGANCCVHGVSSGDNHITFARYVDDVGIDMLCFRKSLPTMRVMVDRIDFPSSPCQRRRS